MHVLKYNKNSSRFESLQLFFRPSDAVPSSYGHWRSFVLSSDLNW